MNIPPALAQEFFSKAVGLAGRIMGSAAAPCGAPGCELRSLGFICTVCQTPLCTDHAAVTPARPPRTLCAPCQMQNWALPGGDAEPAPPPRPRTKKRARR